MFKNFIRILSLLLIVSLLWNMLPVSVLGADLREALNADDDAVLIEPDFTLEEKEPEEITILGELTERRTENIKEYLLSNGNTLAAVYGDSVHYQENGEWKDIDNTLIAKNGTYVNTAGVWDVSFPQTLNSNNRISITKDGYTLSFGMAGRLTQSNGAVVAKAGENVLYATEMGTIPTITISAANASLAQVQQLDFVQAKTEAQHPELVRDKLTSRLSYSQVYANTDVVYDLDGNRVKESVILSKYDSTLRGYRYTLYTGGMIPVLGDDGHIDFYDAEQKEIILTMPAPFLVDASFEYNWDVDVTLTGSNGTYTLTYTLPHQWLAEEDRAWPVVLDPVVQVQVSATTIADQTVFSNGSDSYTSQYLQCGCDTGKGTARFFLKFIGLPALNSADVIVDAKVSLHKAGTSSNPFYIGVHGVNAEWASNTITWTGQPNFDGNATDFVIVSNTGAYSWDVTDLARQWYQSGNNYGMMFKASDTVECQTGVNNCIQFYSSDSNVNKPALTLAYRNTAGLESYWDYTTASAGRAGAAYVNNSAGNLVFTRNLMGFDGNRMPVSIDLVYNASDKGNNSFGFGYGWRTNYHQTVEKLEGTDYYIWTDADGTKHYFKFSNDDGCYHDEDNVNLTLFDNGSTKVIKDRIGNASTFDSGGRLVLLENFQATKSSISITYAGTTNNMISTITDGAGRVYAFTYSNSLVTKVGYKSTGTAELHCVTLSYTSSNLTSITDADNASCSYAYTNHLLTKANDPHGVGLTFTYQSNRISQVKEHQKTTANNTTSYTYANFINFTYGNKWTKLTDKQGNVQHMLFNAHGNTVSIQDNNGGAVFAKYATEEEIDGQKNQLTLSSDLQGTTVDLLTNGNFEKDTGFTVTGDEDSSFVNLGLSGSQAFYIETISDSAGTVSFGSIVIGAGETYTLSAYFKTNYGSAYVRFVNGSTVCAQSESLTESERYKWVRLAVSYTNTTGNAITITPQIYVAPTSMMNIDGVQLEKSAKTGKLNLLENGDFTIASSDTNNYCWTHTNLTSDDGRTLLTTTSAAPVMDSNAMKIVGSPTTQKRVSQQVNVRGSAGDVFALAGWGKGYVPENNPTHCPDREFGLELTIHNTDGTITTKNLLFSPHLDSWQYIAGQLVADKAYNSVTVTLICDYNVNDVYFDGIQFFNEGFGTTYTYNNNGDVKSVTDSQGQTTTYEYTGRNLTKVTNYAGDTVVYTYDSYKNVTKETVTYAAGSTGASSISHNTVYTYDTYGNLKTVKTPDLQTTTYAYNTNGNYLTSVTDGMGRRTTYSYNVDTGVLNNARDPAYNTTYYTYDSLGRTLTTTQGTGTNAPSVSYAYSGDRLSAVSTASTGYTFTYGTFGSAQTVKAGSHTLATYTYDSNQNLSSLTYGNNDKVEYTYDTQGRLIKETYINGTERKTVTYTYDASGKLTTVNDGLSGRITTYHYDPQDRLVRMAVYEGGTYLYGVGCVYNSQNEVTRKQDYSSTQTPSTTVYFRNAQHLIESISRENVFQTSAYNAWGLPTQLVTKDTTNDHIDVVTQAYTYGYWTYDADGEYDEFITSSELFSHEVGYGGKTQRYEYEYDSRGNITQILIYSTGGATSWKFIRYVYDASNQLIRENNQIANRTWVMTYDTAGNMTGRKEYNYTLGSLGTPLSTQTFTYGDSTWGDRLTGINGTTVTSDEIGNITSDGTSTYTWKNGRQLATLSKAGNTWSFEYDASGMRTKRTDGSTTYTYIYDGSTLNQMKVGSNTLVFIYGSNGHPMAVKYNGTYYYYATNAFGDVVAIADGAGNEVVTYNYDAWGNVLSIGGTMASTLGLHNPFRYRSYVYDQETGLYYLQSRYYNPTICRFISADAYVSTGHGILGYNMFAYCNNNPVKYVDHLGYFGICYVLDDPMNVYRAFMTPGMFGAGGGDYVAGISSSYYALQNVRAYDRYWRNSSSNPNMTWSNGSVSQQSTNVTGALEHNICNGKSTEINGSLPKNGTKVSGSTALDMAIDFLSSGYTEVSPGRFVSADGFRQVRMGDADLMGLHAGGPHINFDRLFPTYKSIHVYFFDD